MKKAVSLLLTFAFAIGLAAPVLAVDNTNNLLEKTSVTLVDSGVFESSATHMDIMYSDLSVQVSEGLNCTMQFRLHCGKELCQITTTGKLEEYASGLGRSILHGCLRGQATIQGTLYNVTVGLTKEASNGSVNAGVVLMPYGDSWSENVIIFSIGDYYLSKSIAESIIGEDFSRISESNIQQQNDISNALEVEAKIRDDISQSIAVCVTFDENTINDYLLEHFSYGGTGGGYGGYSLYSVKVGVKENSSFFGLNDVEDISLGESEEHENPHIYDNFINFIWAVVHDTLTLFGKTTSATLDALLGMWEDDPYGPEEGGNSNNKYVTLPSNLIYDDIMDIGFACTFSTYPNTSLTPGQGTATGYGNATFRVMQGGPLGGSAVFYVDAEQAEDDVIVTVGQP